MWGRTGKSGPLILASDPLRTMKVRNTRRVFIKQGVIELALCNSLLSLHLWLYTDCAEVALAEFGNAWITVTLSRRRYVSGAIIQSQTMTLCKDVKSGKNST